MRKPAFVALFGVSVLVVGVLLFWVQSSFRDKSEEKKPVVFDRDHVDATTTNSQSPVALPTQREAEDPREQAGFHITKISRPVAEMTAIDAGISEYRKFYGTDPQGSTSFIGGSLLGANPRQIVFVNWNASRIGPNKELLDPWKKPYSIKVDSQGNVEIMSSGPDGTWQTEDDIIAK